MFLRTFWGNLKGLATGWCCHCSSLSRVWLCDPMNTRLSCPSLSPRACSNSCPLTQWCHPTISSFVAPFSSCPQTSPPSGSFLMSRLFPSGGPSIGASASVLLMSIQDWFSLGLTGLISLKSKGKKEGMDVYYSWFSLLCSRNEHDIVRQLYSNKNLKSW